MVRSLTFKLLLYCFVQMEIFESAASSFISWSHPTHNRNYHTGFNIDLNSDIDADARFGINHWRPLPLIAITARTNSKTRLATSDASAPYGNVTIPLLTNSEINEPIEIPIIGPLLNIQKPIIIGDSIWLNPPTPLQWKAVEASVTAQHGGAIMNWKSTTASEIDSMVADEINLATIAKSPIVAILHSGGKDYATIAAIEGIVTKRDGSIDTSDAESFRESLASLSSTYYSDSSKLRLMAIGRAKVSHFTTKFLMDDSFIESHDYDEMKDIESDGRNIVTSEPLLVARMELLFDSNEEGKMISSPVHALNRLSTFSQRVRFLQQDRQRIVRGLQAAESRLQLAMDGWKDWDGIGSINADLERHSSLKGTKSQLLNDDHTSVLNQFLEEHNTDETVPSTPTHSLPISLGAARCIALDNYGLGTTSSAFVSFSSMSDVLMENLKIYYSPTRLQSEEFEYEVFSLCALRSLQFYLSSGDIYEALFECTNTCARLEIIYHAMIKHKMELKELAEAKSLELRNCGEECDLF